MKQYLLPPSAHVYKANLHVHTTVSDGELTPEEIKALYKANGYSVVAFTDHQILLPHPELNDENFLTITATEVAVNRGDYVYEPSTHYNLYAKNPNATVYPTLDPDSFWKAIQHTKAYLSKEARNYHGQKFGYEPKAFNHAIQQCKEAGFLVCLNHPVNSFQNYSFYGSLKELWGVECFNASGFRSGYFESMQVSEDLWREGECCAFPIAADDAHNAATCCHGYVMIHADKLEYRTVTDALERGDFYASTGITVQALYIEDGFLCVETDGFDEILLSTPIRFRRLERSLGTPILSWRCDIRNLFDMWREHYESGLTANTYLRLDLKRRDGAEAHTRAYFLDML